MTKGELSSPSASQTAKRDLWPLIYRYQSIIVCVCDCLSVHRYLERGGVRDGEEEVSVVEIGGW